MWAAMELMAGQNPYQSLHLSSHPWQVLVQPPCYYYLVSWFFKITGAVYYPMRMVSMFSFIVCLVYAYRIFALSGATRLSRLIGLNVFMYSWVVWEHSFQGRSDMLGLVLALLALHQYLLLARKRNVDSFWRLPRLIVMATLCTLAIFTRQAMIIIVPAIAAALIFGRQWRLSLIFMGLCAFLTVSSLLLLNGATAGGMIANLSFAGGSHFSWHYYHEHLTWLGSDWLLLVLGPLALVSLIWGYASDPDSDSHPVMRSYISVLTLLFIWLSLALILIGYSLGLAHAAVDQSILGMFAVAWLVALASNHWKRRYLLFVFLLVAVCAYVQTDLSRIMENQAQTMGNARQFLKNSTIQPRLMLVEDPSIAIDMDCVSEFIDLPTFLQVWLNKPAEYAEHMAEIRGRIEKREYGAIIINSEDGCLLKPRIYWEPEIIEAIKVNYRPVFAFMSEGRSHDIYLPRVEAEDGKSNGVNSGDDFAP